MITSPVLTELECQSMAPLTLPNHAVRTSYQDLFNEIFHSVSCRLTLSDKQAE